MWAPRRTGRAAGAGSRRRGMRWKQAPRHTWRCP
jgi:hypothetical protein